MCTPEKTSRIKFARTNACDLSDIFFCKESQSIVCTGTTVFYTICGIQTLFSIVIFHLFSFFPNHDSMRAFRSIVPFIFSILVEACCFFLFEERIATAMFLNNSRRFFRSSRLFFALNQFFLDTSFLSAYSHRFKRFVQYSRNLHKTEQQVQYNTKQYKRARQHEVSPTWIVGNILYILIANMRQIYFVTSSNFYELSYWNKEKFVGKLSVGTSRLKLIRICVGNWELFLNCPIYIQSQWIWRPAKCAFVIDAVIFLFSKEHFLPHSMSSVMGT